jgi:hypothetical protein
VCNSRRKTVNNLVIAIFNTIVNLASHFKGCLDQRLSGDMGSWFEGEDLDHVSLTSVLLKLAQTAEKAEHPGISGPATGYRWDSLPEGVRAFFGMADIQDEGEYLLKENHGNIQIFRSGDRPQIKTPVSHGWFLVGPNEAGDVLWTAFPGDVVASPRVTWEDISLKLGRMVEGEALVSGAEAKAIGWTHAK